MWAHWNNKLLSCGFMNIFSHRLRETSIFLPVQKREKPESQKGRELWQNQAEEFFNKSLRFLLSIILIIRYYLHRFLSPWLVRSSSAELWSISEIEAKTHDSCTVPLSLSVESKPRAFGRGKALWTWLVCNTSLPWGDQASSFILKVNDSGIIQWKVFPFLFRALWGRFPPFYNRY